MYPAQNRKDQRMENESNSCTVYPSLPSDAIWTLFAVLAINNNPVIGFKAADREVPYDDWLHYHQWLTKAACDVEAASPR